MGERAIWEIIAGKSLGGVEKPADGVQESLSAYPRFEDDGHRIESVLSIMVRPWPGAPAVKCLVEVAYRCHDAIGQTEPDTSPALPWWSALIGDGCKARAYKCAGFGCRKEGVGN